MLDVPQDDAANAILPYVPPPSDWAYRMTKQHIYCADSFERAREQWRKEKIQYEGIYKSTTDPKTRIEAKKIINRLESVIN